MKFKKKMMIFLTFIIVLALGIGMYFLKQEDNWEMLQASNISNIKLDIIKKLPIKNSIYYRLQNRFSDNVLMNISGEMDFNLLYNFMKDNKCQSYEYTEPIAFTLISPPPHMILKKLGKKGSAYYVKGEILYIYWENCSGKWEFFISKKDGFFIGKYNNLKR